MSRSQLGQARVGGGFGGEGLGRGGSIGEWERMVSWAFASVVVNSDERVECEE